MTAAALPLIAERTRCGRVKIYTRSGHLILSVERALAILRGRRRTGDPTAPALAEAIDLTRRAKAS